VTEYVEHYNEKRLHSAIGYVTPRDKIEGRADEIHAAREKKLDAARERRKAMRAQQACKVKILRTDALETGQHSYKPE
jgi:pyruvoyl-dependent arginine decarboxylase (PvlArgDC)